MINRYKQNKTPLIIISVISLLIPLLWLFYLIISTRQESVQIIVNWHPVIIYSLIVYYTLIFLFILGLSTYWIVTQIKTIIQLKNEKKKTELIHLKSQVNPHFFFNMLNNLYGLISKDTDKAKQLVLKLSDMMRYSIYEGLKETVLIKEEIEFIVNFIDLHKMRYKKNININFQTEIHDENINITPLLFIILVENAFKHGIEVLRDEALVNIKLKATKSKIIFNIENKFDPSNKTEKGIGLKNLTRRLELSYPTNHNFTTSIKNNTFKALLTITI